MKGVNSSAPRARVEECRGTRGEACGLPTAPELLSTRTADVLERRIVDCTPGCVYAALSHVCGGVRAEEVASVGDPPADDRGQHHPLPGISASTTSGNGGMLPWNWVYATRD